MSTAWTKATKILATTALAAFGALSIGCGPAPGYEESAPPRVPVGYTSVNGPEPATSEELAARAQAAQQAQLEGNDPQAAASQPGNGDIVVGADNTEYTDTDPSALNEFKPALDGHGQWVDDSTYGTVWVPNESEVGTDFVPYTTAGHWTYADDTNYVWVSDYSWGWAPFHYGRWAHVGPRGWVWIPGRTYAGAWVTWRYGAGYDYVGWAPAGPEWYWYNGYAVGWGWGWSPYYSYCHHDHFYDRRIGGYIVRGHDYESHTRPYVGGSSGPGGPGGRVAANPTVGGSAGAGGRVAATPTVGSPRTAAMARVAGPSPAEMGIQKSSIVAPPSDNTGLARAHALATPATAVAHGAAPPATAIRRRVDHNDAIVSAPGAHGAGGVDGRSPVASRFEPAARSPQVQGVSPAPYRAPSATSSSAAASRSFAGNGASAPAYRSSPSVASSPSYRSAPSFSAPSYRSAPSQSSAQSSPSFHSAPSVSHSSPPPAPHVSAPSAPRPSSRSSGGSRGGRR